MHKSKVKRGKLSRGAKKMGSTSTTHFPVSGNLEQTLSNRLRGVLRPVQKAQPMSVTDLLQQLEEATTPHQLTRLVNHFQSNIWKLPQQEQTRLREQLADVLSLHLRRSADASMRFEAVGWLRLLVQAGYLPQPGPVFVTIVTAATHVSTISTETGRKELAAYLKMLYDCFWPFRYPYAAYTWEKFPPNDIFYPLAPLFEQHIPYIEELLISIFAELPTLRDAEIEPYLLPVALRWANHVESEYRQRIAPLLARMSSSEAHMALAHLMQDVDPLVRASANRAAESVKQA